MNADRDCLPGRKVGKCDSCDLTEAEKEIKQLRNELRQQKLVHIGFTNDHQVRYATEEKSEAAFYPDSENECYIPVYMLDIHDHRVGYESVIYCENIARKKKIAELTRQNAELVAQVERLRDAWAAVKKTDWDAPLDEAFEMTPTQCLAEHNREVAARAVRYGYLEGVYERSCDYMTPQDVERGADYIANKIKSGEVEL